MPRFRIRQSKSRVRKSKKPPEGGFFDPARGWEIGAGEGIRTLDPNLGKVVLYP